MTSGRAPGPDPLEVCDRLMAAFNQYEVDKEAAIALVAVGAVATVIGGGLEIGSQAESAVPIVLASFGVVSLFGGACANAITEVRFRRAVNRL